MTTRARQWEKQFLASVARHCNITQAAKDAGIARRTAYGRRDASPDFAEKWDDAIEEAIDAIEIAVYTESLGGDMQTARWFLSRRRPQVWGDKLSLEHRGKDGGPVEFTLQLGEAEDTKVDVHVGAEQALQAKIMGMAQLTEPEEE